MSLNEDILVALVDEAEAFSKGEGLQNGDDVYEILSPEIVLHLVEVGDLFEVVHDFTALLLGAFGALLKKLSELLVHAIILF